MSSRVHRLGQELAALIHTRSVEVMSGLTVRGVFTDGTVRDIDLAPYPQGPVLELIRHAPEMFRAVRVKSGTLAWPNGADIGPDVRWRAEAARLSLAAADGLQLATAETTLDHPLDPFTAVVPARALEHFTRIVSDRDPVSVGLSAERIVLETAGLTLTGPEQLPDARSHHPRGRQRLHLRPDAHANHPLTGASSHQDSPLISQDAAGPAPTGPVDAGQVRALVEYLRRSAVGRENARCQHRVKKSANHRGRMSPDQRVKCPVAVAVVTAG